MADYESLDGRIFLTLRGTRLAEIDGPGIVMQRGDTVAWLPESRYEVMTYSTKDRLVLRDREDGLREYEYDIRDYTGMVLDRFKLSLTGSLTMIGPWRPGDPEPEPKQDIVKAAREFCQSLDGTHGKTWSQVAEHLEMYDDIPTTVDSRALAKLVRVAMAGVE